MQPGFLDDVYAKKNKVQDRVVPALVKTGVAASGGMLASLVDAAASEAWPKSPASGPVFVTLMSVALRIFADGSSALERIAQELAAGMAGWIGQDLWYLIRNFLGLGFQKWEANKDYGKGAQVKFSGKLYRSAREVKGGLTTPDKDLSWNLIEGAAQGFRGIEPSQLREYAQALANDKERWVATSIDVLNRVGPHLEETTGHQFTPEQQRGLVAAMADVLQKAVAE